MSHTAYSQTFSHELDFHQLLKLREITTVLDQADYGISDADRAWMRDDLLCPSCRCAGASAVRSDISKSGKGNIRQAHFRFLNSAGQSAHKVGCDFYPLEDQPGIQRGVDIPFYANDKDTKIVRELVCRAISAKELSRDDIFGMRSWFIQQRDLNMFEVKGTPLMAAWLWAVHRNTHYHDAMRFEPIHKQLPGFLPRRAAERELALNHKAVRGQIPKVFFEAETRDRLERIIANQSGEKLVSMEHLRPQFEATGRLAHLMIEYGGLQIGKRGRLVRFHPDVPKSLLAFAATLMFVENWDEAAAFKRFARVIKAPTPNDLTLANVMGLNPFHDFAVLELARFIAALPQGAQHTYDYEAEKSEILARIAAAPN